MQPGAQEAELTQWSSLSEARSQPHQVFAFHTHRHRHARRVDSHAVDDFSESDDEAAGESEEVLKETKQAADVRPDQGAPTHARSIAFLALVNDQPVIPVAPG